MSCRSLTSAHLATACPTRAVAVVSLSTTAVPRLKTSTPLQRLEPTRQITAPRTETSTDIRALRLSAPIVQNGKCSLLAAETFDRTAFCCFTFDRSDPEQPIINSMSMSIIIHHKRAWVRQQQQQQQGGAQGNTRSGQRLFFSGNERSSSTF